ncbi:radical SAM peptide maturase [uncultured Parabacteroides sp.]|uniref:radical SAM peptide maturase n=1 Tax=uncultured Parabacteroides sp. TaxID=512312 RepID=UPI0025942C52|nr:radical SAM peptide maturase [uncultured Parabacteroides sp.]
MKNMEDFLNIYYESPSMNNYYLDEYNSQIHFIHPLLGYCYKGVIESNIDEFTFLNGLSFPISINDIDYTFEQFQYYYNKFLFFKSKGLFIKRYRKNIFSELSIKDIENAISNTEQIVIEMTQCCNLRCVYCAYGELYNKDELRKDANLSFSDFRIFFDYLYTSYFNDTNNNSTMKKINICFYGGEPLLRFDQIKDIVDYVSVRNKSNLHFTFSITTNGILLTNRVVEFLYKNDFTILISIDGDKYNNAYRLFPSGKESFDLLINNIDFISKMYPAYFVKKIFFSAVLHKRNSVNDINQFLMNKYNKIAAIGYLNLNSVRSDKMKEIKKIQNDVVEDLFDDKLQNKNSKSLLYDKMNVLLKGYDSLSLNSLNELFISKAKFRFNTGTCIPFKKKIFLTVDGLILPCEKINFKYHLSKIENKRLLLDLKEVLNTHNKMLDLVRCECNKCYYNLICNRCIYNMPDVDKDNFQCQDYISKKGMIDLLSKITLELEKKPIMYMDYYKEHSKFYV